MPKHPGRSDSPMHKGLVLFMATTLLGAFFLLLVIQKRDMLNSGKNLFSQERMSRLYPVHHSGNESLPLTYHKATYTRNSSTYEPMQDLDIYLRTTSRQKRFTFLYEYVLVQSLKYFWPFDLSFVLVLDDEYEPDHKFGDAARKEFPFPKTCYMQDVGLTGMDRMQRDMFYPEICTSKTYVGYVDTDSMFVTKVTPDLLFDGNKPIIRGAYGSAQNKYYMTWARETRKLFGTKEIMRCMSYHPVIVKIQHIIELRIYIEKLHNASFDKVMPRGFVYSQFNVMCQYLWLFHRDEYRFYVQFRKNPPLYSPDRENISTYKQILSPEQTQPFPISVIHYKYQWNWTNPNTYRRTLKSGVCFSYGFDLCPDKCKEFNRKSLHAELFRFETTLNWSWDKRCIEAQNRHYSQLYRYASDNYSSIILQACEEVDQLQFIWM